MSQPEQLDETAPRQQAIIAGSDADGLPLRVEEASLNAWPATSQLVLDGWLIRLAQGFTKRANSVVPLYPGSTDITEKVRFCENLYARERLKTIFRITSIDDHQGLDACLAARGYRRQDPTEVLAKDLALQSHPGPPLQQQPLRAWLDTYARLTRLPPELGHLHQAILRNIPLPCCHAIVGCPDDPVACGLGVLEQDLVGLFDVVTRADARRAGHGEALVSGLLAWASGEGARTAYLQVAADNAPALALYHKLGFRPLYRYWYRVSG
jgi:ribosomal protein S18 acetylase RimI-like enzyme